VSEQAEDVGERAESERERERARARERERGRERARERKQERRGTKGGKKRGEKKKELACLARQRMRSCTASERQCKPRFSDLNLICPCSVLLLSSSSSLRLFDDPKPYIYALPCSRLPVPVSPIMIILNMMSQCSGSPICGETIQTPAKNQEGHTDIRQREGRQEDRSVRRRGRSCESEG